MSRTHRQVYPYQRAAYNYSNVTYGTDAGLADPLSSEDGRLTAERRRAASWGI